GGYGIRPYGKPENRAIAANGRANNVRPYLPLPPPAGGAAAHPHLLFIIFYLLFALLILAFAGS
ncbi:hypothetical protein, partial [Gemmiger formicilis]